MKKLFTLTALALSIACQAQPVISNGNNMPPVGYSDSVAVVLTGANPGSSGANVTWDFSVYTPAILGTYSIVDPATTPYGANFPSATLGIELKPFTGTSVFEFYQIGASKWEVVGSNISSSSGDDYTANPKTMILFPFSFGNSITDTFTKQNGTHTVTITYDGYGTLITPYTTYNNVVRIKREFGGSDYFYDWFVTTPYLMYVATYDNNVSRLTFVGKSMTTSVNDVTAATNVMITPNPMTSVATFRIHAQKELKDAWVIITDVAGRVVNKLQVKNEEAVISRDALTSGLYFYNLIAEGKTEATGKFVIE